MNYKICSYLIALIGFDCPQSGIIRPPCFSYFSLQYRVFVKFKLFCNNATVLKSFRSIGVFSFGYKSGFFKQRKVNIRFNITRSTRISVPIPSSSKISSFFYNFEIVKSCLSDSRSSKHSAKTTPNNGNFSMKF